MGRSNGKKFVQPEKPPSTGGKPFVRSSNMLPAAGTSAERLCWRFSHVDHDRPWGFSAVDGSLLIEILRKLSGFESMTVNELRRTRKTFKEYDLPGPIIQDAVDRLAEMRRDDMTKIQRLELTGLQRLYGFLDSNVFHVVWWDPEHAICPSIKKHT